MNNGLIVGRVLMSNGKPARGAKVMLTKVVGNNAFDIGKLSDLPSVTCDSASKFALTFAWAGTDWAEVSSAPLSLFLAAYLDHTKTAGRVTTWTSTNMTRVLANGYVQRDWNSLLNVFYSDPTSSKLDCAEFYLDILKAIKGLNFSPPIKAQTLTTESYIIVGGKTIYLTD